MVNCNPETVSTDYDTSDRLYFEPLTLEDVLEIISTVESPFGVIVQFGGQTPLNLAARSRKRACRSSAPCPPPSTWPRTGAVRRGAQEAQDLSPESGIAASADKALKIARAASATR